MIDLGFTLLSCTQFVLFLCIYLNHEDIKKVEQRLNKRIDYKYDEFIGD